MALVSSLLELRIENLNFARTSDLLQETRRRYNDKYSLLSSSSPLGLTRKHLNIHIQSIKMWKYTEGTYKSNQYSLPVFPGLSHDAHTVVLQSKLSSSQAR
jgi:hypothetical protein